MRDYPKEKKQRRSRFTTSYSASRWDGIVHLGLRVQLELFRLENLRTDWHTSSTLARHRTKLMLKGNPKG